MSGPSPAKKAKILSSIPAPRRTFILIPKSVKQTPRVAPGEPKPLNNDGKEDLLCDLCTVPFEVVSETGMVFCPQCLSSSYPMNNFSANNDAMMVKEATSLTYRKVNHLIEFLNHVLVKNPIKMETDDSAKVMRHLVETQHVTTLSDITIPKVKRALRETGMKKLVEKPIAVYSYLTGIYPDKITLEEETKIRARFDLMEPVMNALAVGSKKVLSYPYILLKLVTLLGMNKLAAFIPVTKTNLKAQEAMFAKISEELGWPFCEVYLDEAFY